MIDNKVEKEERLLDELLVLFSWASGNNLDPENTEVVNDIMDIVQDPNEPMSSKLYHLINYNEEWFPDELSKEEQKIYCDLIQNARNYINLLD